VRTMVNWRDTFEVLPAILVVGVSFALTQFFWSNYVDRNLVDIMGGVVSIGAAVIFLRFWRPRRYGGSIMTKKQLSFHGPER